MGCDSGLGDVAETPFRPPADASGEYEVEDILDHRTHGSGRTARVEYLVKWAGYNTFEATWEPVSNLTGCPRVLKAYRQRRGLR